MPNPQRIKSIVEEFTKKLNEALAEEEPKRSRFKPNEKYFYIGNEGKIYSDVWCDDELSKDRLVNFNAFPTKEDAELAQRYRLMYYKYCAGLDGFVSTLWNDYRTMMKRCFGE